MLENKKEGRRIPSSTWQHLKQNRMAYYSCKILILLCFIAILAPYLATDLPLYCKYKGTILFPAFALSNTCELTDPITHEKKIIQYDIMDWKHLQAEDIVFAPVAYSPGKTDFDNSNYVSPSAEQLFVNAAGETVPMPIKFRHWLGTNKSGEDVLSGLINGTRISLLIGVLSMGIASVIGIILGGFAGYFGDKKLHTSRGVFWMVLPGCLFGFYYGFTMRSFELSDALAVSGLEALKQLFIGAIIFCSVLIIFYFIGKVFSRLPFFNKQVYIPVDSIICRLIEILISMPLLILIISISAIIREKSIVNVMVIIGLTSWTTIARLTRAEFLRVSTLDYIQTAKALGYKELRIVFKHALPNAISPAFVAVAFGVASAILTESALSFLGIGVPPAVVTWGSLLFSGREQYNAWWLVVFPGLAIFLTVTIYNLLGEGLRDALDPKSRK